MYYNCIYRVSAIAFFVSSPFFHPTNEIVLGCLLVNKSVLKYLLEQRAEEKPLIEWKRVHNCMSKDISSKVSLNRGPVTGVNSKCPLECTRTLRMATWRVDERTGSVDLCPDG